MENIPDADRDISLATFIYVPVIRSNKQQKSMAKCINCNMLVGNSNFFKWKHWKYCCPHKLLFIYVYPTNVNDKITVQCLVCKKHFDTFTLGFMSQHRTICEGQVIAQHNVIGQHIRLGPHTRSPLQLTNTSETNHPKEITHEPHKNAYTVSTEPQVQDMSTINLDGLNFDKKKSNNANETNNEFIAECRFCNEAIAIDTIHLLHHRTHCKASDNNEELIPGTESEVQLEFDSESEPEPEPEMLISVHTMSTATAVNDIDGPAVTPAVTPAVMPKKNCFICNSQIQHAFADLYGTVSDYSGTAIYDFVWKLLGNKPSVRNATTDAPGLTKEVICIGCLKIINKYDEARTNVKVYKKVLRNKLTQTEAFFEKHQNGRSKSDEMSNDSDVIDLCDDM